MQRVCRENRSSDSDRIRDAKMVTIFKGRHARNRRQRTHLPGRSAGSLLYTTTDTLPQTQNTDSKRTSDDDDKAERMGLSLGYADVVEKFEASCWF